MHNRPFRDLYINISHPSIVFILLRIYDLNSDNLEATRQKQENQQNSQSAG